MTASLNEDSQPQKTSVLVCDDHDIVRQALRAIINGQADMKVIAEASSGEQALHLAAQLKPAVVLMDIELPGMSGIAATRAIKERLPDTTIIALTIHDCSEYIVRIFEAGATGFLTKGILGKEIPAAIRAARNCESMLSREALQKLLDYVLCFPSGKPTPNVQTALTHRELETLQLVAEGHSNKSIASQLNVSENTVKKYMTSIFDKLRVQSRTAAVVAACQRGIISMNI
jgi:DNA-binding NarL/FixJ family response regulator